ncbi:MAG TPA: AAA family ATPase [Sphingomicrobium sp.]|nr:AAA family ATPase [Sphingomicrobium sp.]
MVDEFDGLNPGPEVDPRESPDFEPAVLPDHAPEEVGPSKVVDIKTQEPIDPERPSLSVIHPADWQGIPIPERLWKVADFVPDGQATLLTGAGAAGKSLVSQLLCTCIGLGVPFLGIEVAQCRTLYITCEDDTDELQRRQEAICAGLHTDLEATRGQVHLLSLYGELGNELCTFNDVRKLMVADRYREIVQTAKVLGIGFVVLDNTSHFFTGNENARAEVAAFVGLCNSLARDIEGAVIMVGFPNKAGDSYSGSTAWENQVRSRLFMETPKDESGEPIDPDYRVLRNEKANYARRGSEVGFVWNQGTFILPPAEGDQAGVAHKFTEKHALQALREIDRRWRAKNPFSASYNSPERYLGSWLQYQFRMSSKAARGQIADWGAAGFIVTEQYDSHTKQTGLRVAKWPEGACGSAAEVQRGDL